MIFPVLNWISIVVCTFATIWIVYRCVAARSKTENFPTKESLPPKTPSVAQRAPVVNTPFSASRSRQAASTPAVFSFHATPIATSPLRARSRNSPLPAPVFDIEATSLSNQRSGAYVLASPVSSAAGSYDAKGLEAVLTAEAVAPSGNRLAPLPSSVIQYRYGHYNADDSYDGGSYGRALYDTNAYGDEYGNSGSTGDFDYNDDYDGYGNGNDDDEDEDDADAEFEAFRTRVQSSLARAFARATEHLRVLPEAAADDGDSTFARPGTWPLFPTLPALSTSAGAQGITPFASEALAVERVRAHSSAATVLTPSALASGQPNRLSTPAKVAPESEMVYYSAPKPDPAAARAQVSGAAAAAAARARQAKGEQADALLLKKATDEEARQQALLRQPKPPTLAETAMAAYTAAASKVPAVAANASPAELAAAAKTETALLAACEALVTATSATETAKGIAAGAAAATAQKAAAAAVKDAPAVIIRAVQARLAAERPPATAATTDAARLHELKVKTVTDGAAAAMAMPLTDLVAWARTVTQKVKLPTPAPAPAATALSAASPSKPTTAAAKSTRGAAENPVIALSESRKKMLAAVREEIKAGVPAAMVRSLKREVNTILGKLSATRVSVDGTIAALTALIRTAGSRGAGSVNADLALKFATVYCCEVMINRNGDVEPMMFAKAEVLDALCALFPQMREVAMALFNQHCVFTIPMVPLRSGCKTLSEYKRRLGFVYDEEEKAFEPEESFFKAAQDVVRLYLAFLQLDTPRCEAALDDLWRWVAHLCNSPPTVITSLLWIAFLEFAGYRFAMAFPKQAPKVFALLRTRLAAEMKEHRAQKVDFGKDQVDKDLSNIDRTLRDWVQNNSIKPHPDRILQSDQASDKGPVAISAEDRNAND